MSSKNGHVEQERYRQAVSYQRIMDSAVDHKNAMRDSVYKDAMREQFGAEALQRETTMRRSFDAAASPSQHEFDDGGLGAPAVHRMMSTRRASLTIITASCSDSDASCSPNCSLGSTSPCSRPISFYMPPLRPNDYQYGLNTPNAGNNDCSSEPNQPSRFSLDAPRPPRIGKPRRASVDFVYEDGRYREINASVKHVHEDNGAELSPTSLLPSAPESPAVRTRRRASMEISLAHLKAGSGAAGESLVWCVDCRITKVMFFLFPLFFLQKASSSWTFLSGNAARRHRQAAPSQTSISKYFTRWTRWKSCLSKLRPFSRGLPPSTARMMMMPRERDGLVPS